MRTTTFPPLRVTPALRSSAEAVLEDGETLSAFVLASVEQQIEMRRTRDAFIERGLASGERARRSGKYVSADAVLRKLKGRLDVAKAAAKAAATAAAKALNGKAQKRAA